MILLVEDDVGIGRSISQGLSAKGFALRWLRQGAGVPDHLATGEVSVVILDVGLPDVDGFELCRQIRAAGHNLPILMLTARGALDDRLEGFEAGADDYLPKPFASPNWSRGLRYSLGEPSSCQSRQSPLGR